MGGMVAAGYGHSVVRKPFHKPHNLIAYARLLRDEEAVRVRSSAQQEGGIFQKLEAIAFQRVLEEPVSTFSVDVDTFSYSYVRRAL